MGALVGRADSVVRARLRECAVSSSGCVEQADAVPGRRLGAPALDTLGLAEHRVCPGLAQVSGATSHVLM